MPELIRVYNLRPQPETDLGGGKIVRPWLPSGWYWVRLRGGALLGVYRYSDLQCSWYSAGQSEPEDPSRLEVVQWVEPPAPRNDGD